MLNALYFLPLLLTKNNRNNIEIVAQGKYFPTIKELFQILFTFGITVFAWIFFRAENISHAFDFISELLSPSIFEVPNFSGMIDTLVTITLICIFILIEWAGREHQYAIQHLGQKWKSPIRYTLYYLMIISIFWFGGKEQQFIYFQF